jgi:hypothetical protein
MHRCVVRRSWLALAAGVVGVVSCGTPPGNEPDAGAGGGASVAGGTAGGSAGGTAGGVSGGSAGGAAVDAGTPGALGSTCTAASECGSGFCVDGVCCTSVCAGTCSACVSVKTGAADGTCAPITTNTDPDDECVATAGTCETGVCNGAGACGQAQNGEVCRPAAGPCDAPETCLSNTCPPDALAPPATVCRPAAGPCDLPETCSAGTAACPGDAVATSATVCRASAGDCDAEERCSGSGTTCPVDVLSSSQVQCRAPRGPCDVAERCSGTSAICPVDVRAPSGEVCRPAAGPCDLEESCSGTADTCPTDTLAPATQVCRPAAGVCDAVERCSGAAPSCPTDARLTSVCRPAAGVCDLAESCDGLTNDCPANVGQPATTEVCAPYRCSATTLMCTSGACNNDNQCAPGSFCRGNACVRGKRIFATSTRFAGDFGGATQADALCQARAQAAALTGTYKAWISTTTVNARDRITQSTTPYYRRSATTVAVIANNYAELIGNGQVRVINFSESGATTSGPIWTGTGNSGVFSGPNCNDWMAGSGVNGRFGTIGGLTVPAWTDDGSGSCSFPRGLYCIEQ